MRSMLHPYLGLFVLLALFILGLSLALADLESNLSLLHYIFKAFLVILNLPSRKKISGKLLAASFVGDGERIQEKYKNQSTIYEEEWNKLTIYYRYVRILFIFIC